MGATSTLDGGLNGDSAAARDGTLDRDQVQKVLSGLSFVEWNSGEVGVRCLGDDSMFRLLAEITEEVCDNARDRSVADVHDAGIEALKARLHQPVVFDGKLSEQQLAKLRAAAETFNNKVNDIASEVLP